MSLTSSIRNKDINYRALMNCIDFSKCLEVIDHHNKVLSKLVHKPIEGTNFPLAGMSVIYGLREYIGGKRLWNQTVASRYFEYPEQKMSKAARAVMMGLMDQRVRHGTISSTASRSRYNLISFYDSDSSSTNFNPTIKDVDNIVNSFPEVLGSFKNILTSRLNTIQLNPTFDGSSEVGGADANMIIDNTLWDIRTTAKSSPLTIDTILQQVGYYLLDYSNTYGISQITWYYTRQNCLFTHPVSLFLKSNASFLESKEKMLNES